MTRITVELSLYPVMDDYVPLIKDFIDRLNSYEHLEVVTNALSTQIVGEHKYVFDILSRETAITFFSWQTTVFVMKIVGLEREIQQVQNASSAGVEPATCRLGGDRSIH